MFAVSISYAAFLDHSAPRFAAQLAHSKKSPTPRARTIRAAIRGLTVIQRRTNLYSALRMAKPRADDVFASGVASQCGISGKPESRLLSRGVQSTWHDAALKQADPCKTCS